MRNHSAKPNKTLSGKVRSSLVLKLNVKMTGMLLSSFLAINLFVSILFFGVGIWKIEDSAQRFLNIYDIPQFNTQTQIIEEFGYQIQRIEEINRGIMFPEPLQRIMALESEDTHRWIPTPKLFSWVR